MKHYELLYIVSSQVPENQLDSVQQEILAWLKDIQATVTKAELWGRRKFAYPIAKEKHGFYFLAEFEADPGQIPGFQKKLKLNKQVLRYMLIDKKPLSAKQLLKLDSARRRQQSKVGVGAITEWCLINIIIRNF